jgi:hypothetical protein
MDTWVGFVPNDEQLRLMQVAFDQFEINGAWPILQFVRLQAAKIGVPSADECLRLLPRSYFYPRDWPLNPGNTVRLTVPALAQLEMAARELDLFLRVLRMFGSRLESVEPSPREVINIQVTANDVRVEIPGISELELQKVFLILEAEPLEGGSGYSTTAPADWRLSMSPEEAGRLGAVGSVEDYLKARHLYPDELPEAGTRIRLGRTEWEYYPHKQLGDPGGFGTLFEGVGPDGEVAVKKLRVDVDVHREIAMAEELMRRDLQWVVPVLAAGSDAYGGGLFVVMPMASGSLQTALDGQGSFDENTAVEIVLAIAEGLAEMADLVHRDLKPDNVLEHEGRWKLADFGIAKFVEDATSAQTLRRWLSEPYAAPEQWRGQRPSRATDVYALGCIAYALLTGRPPFKGPDYQAQHLNQSPPSLDASPRLRALVSSMLLKEPASRPSIESVRSQLETIGDPTHPASGASALSVAASSVAEEIAQEEAKTAARRAGHSARGRLATDGLAMLSELMSTLWTEIKEETSLVAHAESEFVITLGDGRIEWATPNFFVTQGLFEGSEWDVVAGGHIRIQQDVEIGEYRGRSSSLWYLSMLGAPDYRWIEVPYMENPLASQTPMSRLAVVEAPFALDDPVEAARASSAEVYVYQEAAKPRPIDRIEFEEFATRWMERLALASRGSLRRPLQLPE